jgi:hypothetical protein
MLENNFTDQAATSADASLYLFVFLRGPSLRSKIIVKIFLMVLKP